MKRHAVIRAAWDPEVSYWYVTDSDIPGLVTEAPTLEELRARIRLIIPDLLDGDADVPDEIEIDLIAHVNERVVTVA